MTSLNIKREKREDNTANRKVRFAQHTRRKDRIYVSQKTRETFSHIMRCLRVRDHSLSHRYTRSRTECNSRSDTATVHQAIGARRNARYALKKTRSLQEREYLKQAQRPLRVTLLGSLHVSEAQETSLHLWVHTSSHTQEEDVSAKLIGSHTHSLTSWAVLAQSYTRSKKKKQLKDRCHLVQKRRIILSESAHRDCLTAIARAQWVIYV